MKILFVYFSKKQMCETVEQAIDFINGLRYRNQNNQRPIVVNDYTERKLRSLFKDEWHFNEFGQPYIVIDGVARYGQLEIATTGCGNTRIYGYHPLGVTVEEHDAAVAARDMAHSERVKAERKLRTEQLMVQRKGWYHVELELELMVFAKRGNDYITHITWSGDTVADSGMDAYDKAVKYVYDNPAELTHRGNMAVLQFCAQPDGSGYDFTFLGMKNEEGYSAEE